MMGLLDRPRFPTISSMIGAAVDIYYPHATGGAAGGGTRYNLATTSQWGSGEDGLILGYYFPPDVAATNPIILVEDLSGNVLFRIDSVNAAVKTHSRYDPPIFVPGGFQLNVTGGAANFSLVWAKTVEGAR